MRCLAEQAGLFDMFRNIAGLAIRQLDRPLQSGKESKAGSGRSSGLRHTVKFANGD